MSVSYLTFRLDRESAGWLREHGIQVPQPLPKSRLPKLRELRSAVNNLDGYHVETSISVAGCSVDFEIVDRLGYDHGWSTTIWAKNADVDHPLEAPSDDDTVSFNFHSGDPELAVLVLAEVSRVCGPLVLVLTADGKPLLVTPSIDPRQAVKRWLAE
jgi:hypothetical protein